MIDLITLIFYVENLQITISVGIGVTHITIADNEVVYRSISVRHEFEILIYSNKCVYS